MSDSERKAAYVNEVGHEPPLDQSDGAWQWDYRGTKAERELLLDLIQNEAEEAVEQMSLC
jgi:hypothetical protein